MLNPFFLQGSSSEQGLIQDLINEQLRMYGVDVYYLPRKYVTERTVIKEVIESKFDNAYPIEAYVDTYDGYEGQGTILSKFGVQPLNDLNLIISKERFETYISPLIRNLPDVKLSTRPKEGDLIWFPLGDRLFEIKFVEHEKPFYQLQKTYVYELRCELFRYEDEIVNTSIDEIDDNVSREGYIQTLTVVGLGVTATATVSGICTTGGVRFVTISNRGNGYTSRPRVAFSSSPAGGTTTVGIATLIGDLVDCNGLTENFKVQGIELINPGCGYTVAPSIVVVGGGGAGFAATTTIGNGVIGPISITNGGGGYSNPPTVTFSGPGTGVTATGKAYISPAGIVTAIYITNAGLGYTQTPTITISSPYSSSMGSYQYNETVTGSISGTTAVVKKWNSVTSLLEVSNISGTFVNGDVLVGSASSASYEVRLVNTDNLIDPYADNDNIEIASDAILDFSETNPFGTP
jgi:hypothetical protein